jgi:formate hydrogenlyase subunit 7
MASSWLELAARRGRLTTRYPRSPATPDEVPVSGHAPRPDRGAPIPDEAVSSCPVGALATRSVDDGTCIRCARCLTHGLRFSGPVEGSTDSRPALVRGTDAPGPGAPVAAGLRELSRSIHLFLVDVGSCTACNREVLALANPFYDLQRLGVFFTNSPRHADVLVVVGVPTPAMVEPLRRAYEAMPAPKAVLAVGVCPISGGIFAGTPGLAASLAEIVPVDAFVPGCPPAPVQVLDGVLRLVGRNRPPGGG